MSVIRDIALVALMAAVLAVAKPSMSRESPMYCLSGLPGQIQWPMNVLWDLVPNKASAGGDFVAVRFSWKAGQYAAIGFSPFNMQGYITACNVPADNTSAAVCTDVIGHNGGGVTKNPTQYSRLLWAKTGDAGMVEAEIEIPVSAVNISYGADGSTRLIFATSTWNGKTNMPEPHNEVNKLILHVNVAEGTIATKSLPVATMASHVYQATPEFSVWWYVVYNTTLETSYAFFNFALSSATQYGAVGISEGNGNSAGVACYYNTTATCVDIYNGKPSPQTFSKILGASKSAGVGSIFITVPLPDPTRGLENGLRKTAFVTGTWDRVKNFPNPGTVVVEKFLNFGGAELFASNFVNTFELFPGHYYANWAIIQDQAGFNQYKMRATLLIKGDHYAGIGFAKTSMGGPLVACHMPQGDALQVVCRDFIGQEQGGVVVNPVQSTEIVTALAVGNGLTEFVVDIDLAKFNVTTDEARMIFAYGTWDATTNMPSYHGPNATFFQVNIYTGKTNGSAPPTVAPQPAPSTALPVKPKHNLKRF